MVGVWRVAGGGWRVGGGGGGGCVVGIGGVKLLTLKGDGTCLGTEEYESSDISEYVDNSEPPMLPERNSERRGERKRVRLVRCSGVVEDGSMKQGLIGHGYLLASLYALRRPVYHLTSGRDSKEDERERRVDDILEERLFGG